MAAQRNRRFLVLGADVLPTAVHPALPNLYRSACARTSYQSRPPAGRPSRLSCSDSIQRPKAGLLVAHDPRRCSRLGRWKWRSSGCLRSRQSTLVGTLIKIVELGELGALRPRGREASVIEIGEGTGSRPACPYRSFRRPSRGFPRRCMRLAPAEPQSGRRSRPRRQAPGAAPPRA